MEVLERGNCLERLSFLGKIKVKLRSIMQPKCFVVVDVDKKCEVALGCFLQCGVLCFVVMMLSLKPKNILHGRMCIPIQIKDTTFFLFTLFYSILFPLSSHPFPLFIIHY